MAKIDFKTIQGEVEALPFGDQFTGFYFTLPSQLLDRGFRRSTAKLTLFLYPQKLFVHRGQF